MEAALEIEAGELQQALLWKTDTEVEASLADGTLKGELGDEIADVLSFALLLAHDLGLGPAEIEAVGQEIAILGMKGLDINNPTRKYTLKTLSGEFSGLHLVSIMYAAFQKTAPGTDVGIDLSREYAQAVAMLGNQ